MMPVPDSPVDTFSVVDKDRPCDLGALWYVDLKGLSLGLRRDRDNHSKSHDPVVPVRGQTKRRSAPPVLMSLHRIEIDCDIIAASWEKHPLTRHSSFPTALPQSVSGWRFSSLPPARSSSSEYFHFRFFAGATMSLPSSAVRSTMEFSDTLSSFNSSVGTRIARLLPHFFNYALMTVFIPFFA